MRLRNFFDSRIVVVLVGLFSNGCRFEDARNEQADQMRRHSWDVADKIASPHDAGILKIELMNRAAVSGRTALIREWTERETQNWVQSSGYALAAYSEVLSGGSYAVYETLLRRAIEVGKKCDEWDREKTAGLLLKVYIAGVWTRKQDLDGIRQWVALSESDRAPATAEFFLDWMESLQLRTRDEIASDLIVRGAANYTAGVFAKYPVYARMKAYARLARFIKGSPIEQDIRDFIATSIWRTDERTFYNNLLAASRACWFLGQPELARHYLAEAAFMLSTGKTGDSPSPCAEFAAAQRCLKSDFDEVRTTLARGLSASDRLPGFRADSASALVLAERADMIANQ